MKPFFRKDETEPNTSLEDLIEKCLKIEATPELIAQCVQIWLNPDDENSEASQ